MAELRVRVTGDTTSFNAALTRARMTAGAFAGKMSTMVNGIGARMAGMFGTAAIAIAVKRTIAWADQLDNTAKRLDVNVERLQEWEYAATQTGASIEDLTTLIEKLKKSQSDAGRGLTTAKAGLAVFGITGADDVETMLNKLAASARDGSINSSAKSGALMDIGGRGANNMKNALKDWEELAELARQAGVIVKSEQIAVLEKISDQFTWLGRYLTAQMAPAIQTVIEKFVMLRGYLAGIGAFISTLASNPINFLKEVTSSSKITDYVRGKMGKGNKVDETDPMVLAYNSWDQAIEDAKQIIQDLREVTHTPPPPPQDDTDATTSKSKKRAKADVDSLAKVGLFTASGLNAQPLMDLERQQLRELKRIAQNTEGEDIF